jgi:5-methylcytosine-specific restriction endonuclease McrA
MNRPEALKVNYGEKLFDPRWKERRQKILKRDQHRCVICQQAGGKLEIHHKQYHFIKRLMKHVDPWDYHDRYLITLCESCHRRGHYKFQVPIKYL